jgi:hypothetical protein
VALISHGSLADFSVQPLDQPSTWNEPADSFHVLTESSRAAGQAFRAARSSEPRGLTMRALQLERDFQPFLSRVFRRTSDVYFVAWAWDLSGDPPALYPASGAGPEQCLIPLRGGERREFMGEGALLFPERVVTSGIALRLQLWESRSRSRHVGEAMGEIADAVRDSKLSSLLAAMSAVTGVTTAALGVVEAAATELVGVIGEILERRRDHYVDYYEGYFPASSPWRPAQETYTGTGSRIVLGRLGVQGEAGNP